MEFDNQPILFTVLKTHHAIIVQDILGDVIWALYDKQVLTEKEYLQIKSTRTREKEALSLLELLPIKGINGFNVFLDYLSIHYSWIANPIKNTLADEYHDMYSNKIQHILNAGEVPQLSSRHVSRTKHVNLLKEHLKKLEAGHFIVVHGMTGCGKSSLVVEVLNDPIIIVQYFQGFVQWVNVGRESSSDVGCIQSEILNRLNNQEQLISPLLNTEYDGTRKTLRNLWREKKLVNGLLVLDDVCNNEIVKYLDIGCKILITTHDTSIMDEIVDTKVKYLKISEGFEEKETLNLFSKCLNVEYTSLPTHASKLHKICKGFPLTISLIGAQLESHREETVNSIDRWKFYLEELSDKNSQPFKYTRHSQKLFQSLERAIEMCIQSLPDNLQKNYLDFALFVNELNIKPEVLCVLWNLKKAQVEDIMLELIRKNLVARIWNQPLNSYVYSIHDLLLSNLKKMVNPQETKGLHEKLIKQYRTTCSGNYAELPKNDNYIFLYFGYHLKNADMLEEFRWFLNLKFLESKIWVTGPHDLLVDLRKYRKYIAVKAIYEKYIEEIEDFVKRNGTNLYKTKSDIIQLGLQEPETSFIYKEACTFARACEKQYFFYNIRASQNCLPTPHISIIRDEIDNVIFGKKHDEVIIASKSGIIKVWNIISHKCLHTYIGHTKRINFLVKNKLKNRFLSTSDDSTIRIWKMENFSKSDDSETRTPSPESRQEHWQNVFHQNYNRNADSTDCICVLDHQRGSVIFAQFSSDGKLVISSSTDKTVKIWLLDNGKVHQTIAHSSIVNRCYFGKCTLGYCLFFSSNSEVGSSIYGSVWPFQHTDGIMYYDEKITSFFPPSQVKTDNKLLITTENKMFSVVFNWGEPLNSPSKEYPLQIGHQNFKLCSISEEQPWNKDNSRYVAFALDDCTIKICDLSNECKYLDLKDPIQGILSLDWFWSKNDQSYWLLCAAEDNSIKLWCLNDIVQYMCVHQNNISHQSNSHFENVCKNEIISLKNYKLFSEKQNAYCYKFQQQFDAVWLDDSSILIAIITKCNTLKILLEGIPKWSIIDKRVSALSIIHANNTFEQTMIIVACEDLSVHVLKSDSSQYIVDTSDKVDQIFTCLDHGQTIAFLLKTCTTKNDHFNHVIEIWADERKQVVNLKNFIDCYVFHDKVIVLNNIHEMKIVDLNPVSQSNIEVDCIQINGSLMLDHSTLVVAAMTSNGNLLNIYKLTSEYKLRIIDKYELPFKEFEKVSISASNDKHFIVVGGQKHIFLIDNISKSTKLFPTDPNVNNINTIIWSSDNTRFALKEDNQIIVFSIKSESKIASIRLITDKFLVDHTLKTYFAVNTAGQLVMLNLLNTVNT